MKKKNIKKFVIIPLIILIIFALIDLPKSHAKYIKTGDFAYDVLLKRIELNDYSANNVSVDIDKSSTYLDAIFNVSFKRNNVMYEDPNKQKSDTKDTYKITLNNNQNKCEIVGGSVKAPKGETSGQNVWYTTLNENDTISFQAKCSVVDKPEIDDANEYITLGFKVEETITNYQGNNDETFTYLQHQHSTRLSEYYTGDRAPTEGKTGLYQEAIKKLKEKYENKVDSTTLTTLIEYFNTTFVDYLASTEIKVQDHIFRQKSNDLKGFTFTENGSDRTYTFEDNFLGYAITWKRDHHTTDKTHYQFAFSVTDKNQREAIFREYLNQYGTDALKANDGINKIINYINTFNGGIDAAFNNKIYEIVPEIADSSNNLIVLHLHDSIINKIDSINASADAARKIVSNRSSQQQAWTDDFVKKLQEYPAILADSNNIFWKIYKSFSIDNPGDIGASVIKNVGLNKDPNSYVVFSDFHIVTGISKNVMINVYSDASTNPGFKESTYFKVFDLEPGNRITLSYPKEVSGRLKDQIDIINKINTTVNNSVPTLITFGTAYNTTTDENGVVHTLYEVDNITYDFYTIDGIEYISYTLR